MKTIIAYSRSAKKSYVLSVIREGRNQIAGCFDAALQQNLLLLRRPAAEDGGSGQINYYIVFLDRILPLPLDGWIAVA
jgi:hypothetical protein